MVIIEMRWPDNGQYIIEGHEVYHFKKENSQHIYGVRLIASRKLQEYIMNFIPVSDRILVIQLNGNPINIYMIQVFAFTSDAKSVKIDQFYNEI